MGCGEVGCGRVGGGASHLYMLQVAHHVSQQHLDSLLHRAELCLLRLEILVSQLERKARSKRSGDPFCCHWRGQLPVWCVFERNGVTKDWTPEEGFAFSLSLSQFLSLSLSQSLSLSSLFFSSYIYLHMHPFVKSFNHPARPSS